MSAEFCVVVPDCRAEGGLAATVARLPYDFYRRGGLPLIIDDASPDATGRVADGLAIKQPGIRVVHHEQSRGYGGAQKTGLKGGLRLGCRAFAIVRGDGQYAPELVLDLLEPILEGESDLVEGSRMLGGAARESGSLPTIAMS